MKGVTVWLGTNTTVETVSGKELLYFRSEIQLFRWGETLGVYSTLDSEMPHNISCSKYLAIVSSC